MTTTISGSNGIVFPDATSMQTGQQACKAWVNFNGQGTVAIRASYGVSSITDNGVGKYGINFSTPLTDGNYSAVFGAPRFNPGNNPWVYQEDYNYARTVSSFSMWTNQGAYSSDSEYVSVAIFR
jgi:hypothetical protein